MVLIANTIIEDFIIADICTDVKIFGGFYEVNDVGRFYEVNELQYEDALIAKNYLFHCSELTLSTAIGLHHKIAKRHVKSTAPRSCGMKRF